MFCYPQNHYMQRHMAAVRIKKRESRLRILTDSHPY